MKRGLWPPPWGLRSCGQSTAEPSVKPEPVWSTSWTRSTALALEPHGRQGLSPLGHLVGTSRTSKCPWITSGSRLNASSHSAGLRGNLRFCTSQELPGDAIAAGSQGAPRIPKPRAAVLQPFEIQPRIWRLMDLGPGSCNYAQTFPKSPGATPALSRIALTLTFVKQMDLL